MIAVLAGAKVTKVRPGVVVSSDLYHRERPDVIMGILTTQLPRSPGLTDHLLSDWRQAGLRASSCFRLYLITIPQVDVSVIGRLTEQDWEQVEVRLRHGLGA
ncbi:MAG: type II toxin-antitoxin system PemK/MazF family toxin [Acidobacteriota bacterium]